MAELDEVFTNINWKQGLPPLMSPTKKTISMVSTFILGCGFLTSAFFLLYASADIIISLNERNQLLRSRLVGEILWILLELFFIYLGGFCLSGAKRLFNYNWGVTDKIYKKMLEAKTILEGELIDVHFAYENRRIDRGFTSGGYREITYQFVSPEGKTIKGSYLTSKNTDEIKNRVCIIYFDDKLNLLL
jgi:hypothetical protein